MAELMTSGLGGYVSSESSRSSVERAIWSPEDDLTLDVIRSGVVMPYTIPSFSVVTVQLRHVLVSVWNDIENGVKHYDAFMCAEPDADVFYLYHLPLKSWKVVAPMYVQII